MVSRTVPENLTKKYSIIPIALHSFRHLHIVQPQREGDGRQALVVPPLYPAPATSLNLRTFAPQQTKDQVFCPATFSSQLIALCYHRISLLNSRGQKPF
jgi:hypothetical protein